MVLYLCFGTKQPEQTEDSKEKLIYQIMAFHKTDSIWALNRRMAAKNPNCIRVFKKSGDKIVKVLRHIYIFRDLNGGPLKY